MESPYKFESSNPRVVTNVNYNVNKIYTGTALLYGASLYMYARKFLRIDGNAVAFGAFAACSLPASYAYVKFFMSDAENEAAYINNKREGV
mgnify:CR=1 FL=1